MHHCRICLEPDNLERLCECRGTVEFVHKKCIQHWIKVSGKKKCELCGAKFDIEELNERGETIEEYSEIDLRKILLCFACAYIFTCIIYLCIRLL